MAIIDDKKNPVQCEPQGMEPQMNRIHANFPFGAAYLAVHTVERGISNNNFTIPFDFSSKLAVFGDMVGEAADFVLLAGDFMVNNPFLICLLFTNPITGKTQ